MSSTKSVCLAVIAQLVASALPRQLAAQQTASATNGQLAYNQGVLDFNGGARQLFYRQS